MARTELAFDKYASEILDHAVDFVDVMGVGETISTRAVTATDVSTGADTSSDVISNIGGSGTEVTYTVQAGEQGLYNIDVYATLNTGEVHCQRLVMQVLV